MYNKFLEVGFLSQKLGLNFVGYHQIALQKGNTREENRLPITFLAQNSVLKRGWKLNVTTISHSIANAFP